MPTIPRPFKRPSISLSGQVEREWREVPSDTLVPGDIVVDRGRVVSVIPSQSAATKVTAVTFQNGLTIMLANHSRQRAFVKVDG